MFEVDELCERIAVIAKGQIVGEGTQAEMKSRVATGNVTEIEVFGVEGGAVERIRALEGVTAVSIEELDQKQLLVVQTAGERGRTQPLPAELPGPAAGPPSAPQERPEDSSR